MEPLHVIVVDVFPFLAVFELDFFYEANIINAFYIQFVVVSVACLYVLLHQKNVKIKQANEG